MSNTTPVLESVIPKCLMEALREAFSIQASTQVEIKSVKVAEPDSISNADLISAIGLRSSTASGTLAIGFPTTTFLGVVNKMLGENYQTITAENSDASSELLNITFASARVKINGMGYDFQPAIPTTTRGEHVTVSHGGNKVVRVECSCEFGPFFLEVSLRKSSGSGAK